MTIHVLGHQGMLGHVVARHLAEAGHRVLTSDKRFTGAPRDPLVEEVRDSGADWVVNAIGLAARKAATAADLHLLNTVLPLHLGRRLRPGQRLVHAGTDGIFAGTRGRYATHDEADATDDYGWSKALGEAVAMPGRAWVIRVSIIGPELGVGHGLMGWFLRQTGPVNGYANHRWNGITTLAWAELAAGIIAGPERYPMPLFQAGSSQPVSKLELLQWIARTWSHPIPIAPSVAPETLDRTLAADLEMGTIGEQLARMAAWYRRSAR